MNFEQKLAFAFGGGFVLLIYFLIRLAVKYRRGDFDGVPPTTSRQNGAPDNVDEHARSRERPPERSEYWNGGD